LSTAHDDAATNSAIASLSAALASVAELNELV
jgi:hypothetical protein